MYPILCSAADGTFQDAGHVTATWRPAPLADKLVKYSQLCSPGDCVTTCYESRDPTLPHTSIQQYKSNSVVQRKSNAEIERKLNTRFGTLIVATIYLQLIQNRYMFRSFTVLQCSHQHCVQPVASDVEVV